MTPKQRVLKRWPKAKAIRYAGTYWACWRIFTGIRLFRNSAPTAAKAWADAARRMDSRTKEQK